MPLRPERREELFKQLAAEFLEAESDRSTLLTVTGIKVSPDRQQVTILFTVLPTEREVAAIGFAKRRRLEFQNYVKSRSRLRMLPRFDFALDEGERHRQKIDELLSRPQN